jgi:putative membrane protein
VFYFEKGPIYYFSNGWFIAKLALFALVGIASIYPTMVYLSWRPALREGRAPEITAVQARRVQLCLRIELAGILAILLAAPLMARGFGHIG